MEKLETGKLNGITFEINSDFDSGEGWASVGLWVDGEFIAEDDGCNGIQVHNKEVFAKIFADSDDPENVEDFERAEKAGLYHRGWEELEAAQLVDKFKSIQSEFGEDFVIQSDNYESETSEGFANTKHFKDADEEEESKYGWYSASKIEDVPEDFAAELVAFFETEKSWSL